MNFFLKKSDFFCIRGSLFTKIQFWSARFLFTWSFRPFYSLHKICFFSRILVKNIALNSLWSCGVVGVVGVGQPAAAPVEQRGTHLHPPRFCQTILYIKLFFWQNSETQFMITLVVEPLRDGYHFDRFLWHSSVSIFSKNFNGFEESLVEIRRKWGISRFFF